MPSAMIALQPAVPSPNQTVQMPPSGESSASELAALLTGAGVAPLTDRAFLRITGADATRWLNGMVTNSIQSLQPGEGNYNFLLNAQGRIQGDCTIYREPNEGDPAFLLETDIAQIETIHSLLDKFIIMDDVELSREVKFGDRVLAGTKTATPLGVAIIGPKAADVLMSAMWDTDEFPFISPPAPGTMTPATFSGMHCSWVMAPPGTLSPSFEIWCSNSKDYSEVLNWLERAGTMSVSEGTLEAFRIFSGTPLYGTDIRNSEKARDLPQETGQTRALHFTKGCYLGQEIVERIHSRGNVHRAFGGFELRGSLPAAGTVLTSDGKPAGELTSVAAVALPGASAPIQLALGYARREALERGQPLEYPGGTASPVSLPYTFS